MTIKMTFLGSGAMGTIENYNSNILLEDKTGDTLLIDCGDDAKRSLHEAGYSYKDINNVYITHLHGDHTHGLEWLGFCTFFDPECKRPNLCISRFLKDDLWKTLSGGMKSCQGMVNTLTAYFDVTSIKRNGAFNWANTSFQLVQSVHVMDGFTIVPSFGLMFNIDGTEIFFTSDTQFCPEQIKDFYNKADIIFQDCETTPYKSGVHAHYTDLVTLPHNIKEKMWLYHYNDGTKPHAKTDGFKGYVEKGQIFEF